MRMVGDFFDIFSKYISSFLRRSQKRPKREVGQGSLVVVLKIMIPNKLSLSLSRWFRMHGLPVMV
jgi:hypothetical protein